MTTSVKRDYSRQPDYHIGPNGIPRLTATGSRMRKMNSPQPLQQPTDPVKLNKCLYNLTVRNGTVRSDKIESDIAIRNQHSSSKSSSSNCSISDRRSSPATSNVASAQVANRNDPRNTLPQSNNSSSIPRISSRSSSSSSMNGSRTLLSGRQQRQRSAAGDDAGNGDGAADVNLINGSSNGDRRRSVVVRQYRLSAAIDNRLSYQRKYDRTVLGCNRLDQFVLPPLQI